MKKSTLVFTLAVLGLVGSLAATNLKLKSEYQKGNITNAYITKPLASFRFIKSTIDANISGMSQINISTGDTTSNEISIFMGDTDRVATIIHNDTLFLNVRNTMLKGSQSPHEIRINNKVLAGILAVGGGYNISVKKIDSLTAIVQNDASMSILFIDSSVKRMGTLNYIAISATQSSSVGLYGNAVINHANLQLKDNSRITLSNITMIEKDIQLGERASIELSGNSIDEFGIRNKKKESRVP